MEEQKKHKYTTPITFFWKRILSNKQNIIRHNIGNHDNV